MYLVKTLKLSDIWFLDRSSDYFAVLIVILLLFLCNFTSAQPVLSVDGKLQVSHMDTANSEDLLVVKKADGFLAGRQISSLFTPTPAPTYAIGDYAQGGIVFWLNASGTHGKVVYMYNMRGAQWSNVTDSLIGNTAQSDVSGAGNTVGIIMQAQHQRSAARMCANLAYGGYDDWYLPAKDELNELYINRYTVNYALIANGGEDIPGISHLTSTEFDYLRMWVQSMLTGSQFDSYKVYDTYHFRAIRAF